MINLSNYNNKPENDLEDVIKEIENFKRIQLNDQDAYSNLRNIREKATFSMMMKMNPDALTLIRKEFFAREDSVTLDQFIYIIQKHLVNRPGDNSFVMETPEQREFGTNMYELFKDIDVNGDGQLEWQEFTSFTVEKANLLNKRQKLTSIAHYHDSSHALDPSAKYRHRNDISRFVNIPSLSQFAIVEDHKNSIFVFNSRLGKLSATIQTESAPIAIETIAEKDKVSLVTSAADMTLCTYSLDDPNPKRKYKLQTSWATPGVQMALAYAPESKLLYSGGTNGNIYSWNVMERNLVTTLSGHTDIVMNLIVLKKLNNIASASLDKTVSVWDSHTKDRILNLHGHKKGVFDLAYNPEHRLIFSCGFEHDALVWSPFVNSLVYRLKGHNSSLVGCQTIEGSHELITADTSGIFKLWDVRNFSCVQTFSANLSGQEIKDSSKLTCFFHSKLASRNALQEEDDSRIYAASKLLFSFDQARVVHEATTDYHNIIWIVWIKENSVIITASDHNVIVWDALVGSKTFTHPDICGEEISACCLDDRKRKIIIGDIKGKIGVYNCSNGQLMKTVHRSYDSAVCSLEYYDEAKRFIVGFSNGQVSLFDENVLEECILIRQIEIFGGIRKSLQQDDRTISKLQQMNTNKASTSYNKAKHSTIKEMLCSRFDVHREAIITVGSTDGMLCFWDYQSSKSIAEVLACNTNTCQIVQMILLDPYPLILTSDSNGNLVIWGSKGTKWIGRRISGFLNMNSLGAEVEPKLNKFDDDDTFNRRILPPKECSTPKLVREYEEELNLSESDKFEQFSFDDFNVSDILQSLHSVENKEDTYKLAKQQYSESVSKWGRCSPAHALAWNAEMLLIVTGDEVGTIRCFSIKDAMIDLQKNILLDTDQDADNQCILNICKQLNRDGSSALAPIDHDVSGYLLAHSHSCMSYLGVRFKWALSAHLDRIICCVCTPEGILTSGADRLVKMWTYDGIVIGTLLQSVPIGTRSKTWDLILDVKSIIAQENKELDEIIEQVTELANKEDNPDINELDFSGMELGAESANFSQSVLRQRIDRSTKILGLNFGSNVKKTKDNNQMKPIIEDDNMSYNSAYTIHTLSTSASLGSKSLVNALKEIKSADSDIDWDLKNKAMSYLQQRRRANKLDLLSKEYEEKSGVQLNIERKQASIWEDEAKQKDKEAIDFDKMLVTSHQVKVDHSNANDDLYSIESIKTKREKNYKQKELLKNSQSKISSSLKEVQENGLRTISMLNSCKKFESFHALNEAINTTSIPTIDMNTTTTINNNTDSNNTDSNNISLTIPPMHRKNTERKLKTLLKGFNIIESKFSSPALSKLIKFDDDVHINNLNNNIDSNIKENNHILNEFSTSETITTDDFTISQIIDEKSEVIDIIN